MYRKETPLQLKQKTVQQDIQKKTTPLHRKPTQSMKSINVEGPSSFINNLVSHHNKYTKEAFSLWLCSTRL